jgi:hypothetical protein
VSPQRLFTATDPEPASERHQGCFRRLDSEKNARGGGGQAAHSKVAYDPTKAQRRTAEFGVAPGHARWLTASHSCCSDTGASGCWAQGWRQGRVTAAILVGDRAEHAPPDSDAFFIRNDSVPSWTTSVRSKASRRENVCDPWAPAMHKLTAGRGPPHGIRRAVDEYPIPTAHESRDRRGRDPWFRYFKREVINRPL